MSEQQFQRVAEQELEALKKALIRAEADADFEVEEQGGVLQILFDDPPGKFVITTNSPVQQVWISALSSSYKLALQDGHFVLPKTGETLQKLVARLVNEHMGQQVVELG
ncbi:MAG: iron donor protein CyaY [Acidobacteriales bacterium]|nr:iron donor protein CyaY [Terriglobales bacterium]